MHILAALIAVPVVLFVLVLVYSLFPDDEEQDKRYEPKFRDYKRVGGNVVADMRSDAEFEDDANRRYK